MKEKKIKVEGRRKLPWRESYEKKKEFMKLDIAEKKIQRKQN